MPQQQQQLPQHLQQQPQQPRGPPQGWTGQQQLGVGQQGGGRQPGLAGGNMGWSEVSQTREQMKMVSADAAAVFDAVSDGDFLMALSTGLTLFGLPPMLQGQMAGGALLATRIAQAVSSSGTSMQMMMSAGQAKQRSAGWWSCSRSELPCTSGRTLPAPVAGVAASARRRGAGRRG
jgi:hypothetical protein